ncbi:hypothetical protein PAMP_002551 [Pampus punctatissimus]
MSQHNKNTDGKQSSLNPEMENEIAEQIVLETHRVCDNVNELMESLWCWKTTLADCNKDEFSLYASHVDQKLDRELNRFFNMRRVFAEYCEEDVTDKDHVGKIDSVQVPSGQGPSLPVTARINKSAGRRARNIYNKIRAKWNEYLKWKTNKEAKLETIEEQGEEDMDEDVDSTIATHLSPVSLGLVDVDQEDKDVTPKEPMEEDQVKTDMVSTPGTSQDQFQEEHVDQADRSATSDSPSKDTETKPNVSESFHQDISDTAEADRRPASRQSDFKNGRQAGRRTSVVYKKMKSLWKHAFRYKKRVVHPFPDQRDEVAAQSDSQGTLRSPAPQEASTLILVCCSDDIRTATESHLSPVPQELVDVDQEDEDVTPKEPMEEDLVTADMDATPGTSQARFEGEHVDEEDRIMDSDSIPGPSDQDRHPKTSQEGSGAAAQLTGLKYTFYYTISQFFNSFTEKELKDIRRGVYNMHVKEQIVEMCMEVLRLIIEAVTNTLSQAIDQFAPEQGTSISPTCSQEHNTEQVDQNSSAEESFHITDDDIQNNVKSSFDEALSDALNLKGVMSPKFPNVMMKTLTKYINSVLSETIKASLEKESAICCQFSCCRQCKKVLMGIVRANESCKDTSSSEEVLEEPKWMWWSCFRRWCKDKGQTALERHVKILVKQPPEDLCSSSSQAASTSCSGGPSDKILAHEDNMDITPEEIRDAPSPNFTGCFPSAADMDTATVPDHQQSPSVACKNSKKDKEKKTLDDTSRKKPSLLRRIQLFFSRNTRIDVEH